MYSLFFSRCVRCDLLGRRCCGPDFLTMDIPSLASWCRLRRDYLNTLEPGEWTVSRLADKSGVSAATINRILSGKASDLRFCTVSAVIRALLRGTCSAYPCELPPGQSSHELDLLRLRLSSRDDMLRLLSRHMEEARLSLLRRDRCILFLCLCLLLFLLILFLPFSPGAFLPAL